MSIEVDDYYKKQAKELTDLLFDKDFLNKDLTRESIDWLQDYIGFVFQSKCDMVEKCTLLTARLKKRR